MNVQFEKKISPQGLNPGRLTGVTLPCHLAVKKYVVIKKVKFYYFNIDTR